MTTMKELPVKSIRFLAQIDNPHEVSSTKSVAGMCQRLVNGGAGSATEISVYDDGPWLRITGKHRVVLVPRTNVSSIEVDMTPAPAKAEKKRGE